VLVRNGRNINQNPAKFSGSVWGDSGNRFKASLRNRDAGGFESAFSAYPSGHLAPGAFALPKSSGALSSTTLSRGVISGVVTLVAGRNLDGSAGLVITVTNAQLDQIVSAVASGSISISAVSAILAGAANMTSSGTLVITVNSALIGAIFSVTASGSSSIDDNAELTALAFMNAEAGGPTALSPEGLANAVWDKAIAAHQTAGTTGKALSDAGGAGNPWSAATASNNTAGTFGALVQKLLTLAKFFGLK